MSNQNKDTFRVMGEDLVKKLKALVHEGNVRRIILKDEKGKNTFLEIPVTIGVIGAVLAPVLAVAGVLVLMVGAVTVEVIREERAQAGKAAGKTAGKAKPAVNKTPVKKAVAKKAPAKKTKGKK